MHNRRIADWPLRREQHRRPNTHMSCSHYLVCSWTARLTVGGGLLGRCGDMGIAASSGTPNTNNSGVRAPSVLHVAIHHPYMLAHARSVRFWRERVSSQFLIRISAVAEPLRYSCSQRNMAPREHHGPEGASFHVARITHRSSHYSHNNDRPKSPTPLRMTPNSDTTQRDKYF